MRVSTLAAACMLAGVRADYVQVLQYPGNACSGPVSTSGFFPGCVNVGALGVLLAPAYAKLVCGATNTAAATWNVYSDPACTTPREPFPTEPFTQFQKPYAGAPAAATAFSTCAATAGNTPATSQLCMKGDWVAPSGGLTISTFSAATCPTGNLYTQQNAPVGLCGMTGLGNYAQSSCSATGATVNFVRVATQHAPFFSPFPWP